MTQILLTLVVGFAFVVWELEQIRKWLTFSAFVQYESNKNKIGPVEELGP